MAILSVQSHVAYGNVGNRAAVFPLELLGFDVWPINTVQFSNHTGYGSWKGEVFSPAHIREVWAGIRDLGVTGQCEAILSGYIGDAGIGTAIMDALADVRALAPKALYCCDPVMGDADRGLYVRDGVVDFFRWEALPRADIVTPNHFEAELLSGGSIGCIDEAVVAAGRIHALGPRIVLITSFKPRDLPAGSVEMFLSVNGRVWTIRTEELGMSPMPNGGGDLTAALFLGHFLKHGNAAEALEEMTNSVFSVFEATRRAGSRELRIVASREAITSPGRRFAAEEWKPGTGRAGRTGAQTKKS